MQIPSRGANSSIATQEIILILCNHKYYYDFHNNQTIFPYPVSDKFNSRLRLRFTKDAF